MRKNRRMIRAALLLTAALTVGMDTLYTKAADPAAIEAQAAAEAAAAQAAAEAQAEIGRAHV